MAKRTIIFRADGGSLIGMGHFSRTLALAEMLCEHYRCVFASKNPTEFQINQIEKICHGRIDLPENDSHFHHFLNVLKGDEIVVLDNYYFTTEYQKEIKAKGCKLVCIDDIYDKHYVADIVINHALGIKQSDFSKEYYTKLCLGFDYALIRKEFRMTKRGIENKKYSTLIILGGSDPLGITEFLLRQISLLNVEKPIAVVSNNQLKMNKMVWFKKLNSKQIAELMDESEIGIFPASTLALEACAKRLPFVCGYFVENQMHLYEGIRNNELAITVGDYTNIKSGDLNSAISRVSSISIQKKLFEKQMMLMDNRSDIRLQFEFGQL